MLKKRTLRKVKNNLNYLFWSFFASSAIADPILWGDFVNEIEKTNNKKVIIDTFFSQHYHNFPIVLKDKVVFVYRGKAKRVFVAGDFNNWAPNIAMKKIAETNIHYITLTFPSDTRLEYKYIVDGKWILDPLNKKTAVGGFGNNSDLHMPDYQKVEWFDTPLEETTILQEFTIDSDILNNRRKLTVYTPAKYDPKVKYPLLIMHDGSDYIRMARIPRLLQKKYWKSPTIVAFVDPINRNYEYGCSDKYKQFTQEELVPFLEEKFSITSNRNQRIFAGASMGGIVSFFLAYELRENFGGAICQSGAFIFPQMPPTMSIDKKIKAFLKNLDYKEVQKLKLWIDCGTIGPLEQFLLQGNRTLHQNLTREKVNHQYLEVNEAHNWRSWAKNMEKALHYIYDGKNKVHR